LKVIGLINVQFASQNGVVHVLEVNPRASRTVPFVSKATSLPLAKVAARCMAGRSLKDQQVKGEIIPPYYSVKEAVFPFIKLPGADTILGPEMKSTGEVMGVGETFAEAFVKSQMATGERLPASGKAFLSVRDSDKERVVEIARSLIGLGFTIVATRGTAAAIGVERELTADDVVLLDEWHAGTYGIPDAKTIEAIRLCARLEGVITDPVYEGKSMAALIDLVQDGRIAPGSRVLYAHLGGQPALNGYAGVF